jgi:tetratricopeptide (TPR) repeat protein
MNLDAIYKSKLPLIFVLFITAVFYSPTLSFDFVNYDDPFYILENPVIHYFNFEAIFLKPSVGLYHPLTTASFALDWYTGSGQAWSFHLTNLIFHLLAGYFLFLCLEQIFAGKQSLNLLITAIFLLHPFKVESVAWVSERKDVLSGFFLFVSFYFYLKFSNSDFKKHYLFALLFFALAMLSKASILFLPLVFLAWDVLKKSRLTKWDCINKLPFLILGTPITVWNALEQTRLRANLQLVDPDPWQLFYQMQFYAQKTLFPTDLRLIYINQSLYPNALGIVSLVIFAILAVWIFKFKTEYRKYLLFGLAFAALFLGPFLKFIPFGDDNIVNDRYMYLPLTGLSIAFLPALMDSSKYLKFVIAGLLTFWIYLLPSQISCWDGPLKMWESFYQREPESKKIASNYAKALLLHRQYEKVTEVLKNSEGTADDLGNYAYAWLQLGKQQEALKYIDQGLQSYPGQSFLLYMKAMILGEQGQYQQALELSDQALKNLTLELSPKLRSQILNQKGLALIRLQRPAEAEAVMTEAILNHKRDEILYYNLGLSQLNQKKWDQAWASLMTASEINPTRSQTQNDLGVIQFNLKNYPEAIARFKKALELEPGNLLAAKNLQATEKAMGQTK